ncbi:MAG: tRNA (adenosine(37)-N6)-threonylcarbamoyltransferase complex ATPase subunit type 1 TsaE [Clostridia bacterium]|nr:tRNA (adenosine(37)-N6)-threonylcarbamoyltransferase complex ATPase subunit type 1 TsaE [Clostridia bacterium]
MYSFFSNSVDSTKELGRKFAHLLQKGDTVVLSGDLGAGKTAFVTGFLSFFEKENEASSPTFTIVNEYNLREDLNLFHFDVYRFEDEDEFTAIGGEEFFEKGICIIEWGERIRNLLPKQYLEIVIEHDKENENARNITFLPKGEKYENIAREVISL